MHFAYGESGEIYAKWMIILNEYEVRLSGFGNLLMVFLSY
jgi:hypothetical protein